MTNSSSRNRARTLVLVLVLALVLAHRQELARAAYAAADIACVLAVAAVLASFCVLVAVLRANPLTRPAHAGVTPGGSYGAGGSCTWRVSAGENILCETQAGNDDGDGR